MNIGMLWFDNDAKADLAAKIRRAAEYYQRKYGQNPNLCFVHPSMIANPPPPTPEIEVRSSRRMLPNHFWLGVNTSQATT